MERRMNAPRNTNSIQQAMFAAQAEIRPHLNVPAEHLTM
jgi:hypothetical protein